MKTLINFVRAVAIVLALSSGIVRATGGLNGLPILNGPIPVVPNTRGMKKSIGDFIHPGLWHTHDDLERIRLGVKNDEEPWASTYANFGTNTYSQANYQTQGPHPVLCRGSCSNFTAFTNDVRAAYQNALMWYITRDQGHWDKATAILDDWGGNLTNIVGTDTSLLVGLEGDMFANAAEIMRWEGNWTERGARATGTSGFSNQLYWLFAKQSINVGQANYGMVSIKAMLSFAVYLDDVALYNYALYQYSNDPCAGIYANFDTATGQSAETGRDQGHAKGGLGWSAEAARVIQSQGFDVHGYGDNLLLRASEYIAKYNLGEEDDVPYDRKFYRCEAVLVNGPWDRPSAISRGVRQSPAVFDIIYYQYVVRRGLDAPWTVKMKNAVDKIGGEVLRCTVSGGTDHPGWGDLIWSYPGKGCYGNNNNRTIWGGGSIGPEGLGNINA
ncbi:chondroitin AC/alginate lyase [Coniochaeta sp. 2T2.1]|nr:chondroitin AC/alginate lyase [Coniochaeta sp. 2T2.1]